MIKQKQKHHQVQTFFYHLKTYTINAICGIENVKNSDFGVYLCFYWYFNIFVNLKFCIKIIFFFKFITFYANIN